MKSITINGTEFELLNKKVSEPHISRMDLQSCYARPSITKLHIWQEWMDWFYDGGNTEFGISSYNSHCFTIHGIVTVGCTRYYVYITKAHNRAYEIV